MTRPLVSAFVLPGLCALSLLSACGGAAPAFSTRFADNRASDIDTLLRRIDSAPVLEGPAIVAGISSAPNKVYAFDLDAQRVLWSEATNARFAPIVTGDFVVTQETGGIVARDLRTGRERFVIDADGKTLNGASAYNATVAIVLTRGNGAFAESSVTLVERDSVQWERDLRFTAGSPAVIGDVVLVPWGNQNITALDVHTGDEFARVRVTDSVVGHVFRQGNTVFAAGQQGFFALTSKVGSGRARDGAHFAHEERELPGRPKLIRDAYALSPMPAADSAEQRIRLSWQPRAPEGDTTGFADDHLYLVFYRFVFAMNPTGTAAAWVYTHDSDIVGSAAQAGGVLLADSNGGLTLISAESGQRVWEANSATPSVAVSFGIGTTPVVAQSAGEPTLSPREQLVTAAEDQDARLVPARVLAVEMLAALDDVEATASLITLCESARLTGPVRTAACNALSKRTQGGDQILAALSRHAGFLEGTTAPPIGALAKAAVAAQVPGVATPLLAHLVDPNTPSRDLPALVTALSELNDAAASAPLTAFLRLYHADAEDEHMITTLKLVIDTLVKLSGAAAIDVLGEVSGDALANFAIREHARLAFEQLEAAAAQAESAATTEAGTTDEGAASATEGATEETTPTASATPATPTRPAGPPARMTLQLVEQTLLPVRSKLRACLKVGDRQYYSARVVLVIEDGSLLQVAVVPQATQACIEPLIRAQTFPNTVSSKRERIDYTLNYR